MSTVRGFCVHTDRRRTDAGAPRGSTEGAKMSRTSTNEESRRYSLQEKHDFEQTMLMQASPVNNVSIVHSSRGLIAVVKLDGSLYVPTSCLSRLVNLDSDEIIDRLEKICIELPAIVPIPPNTENDTMIRSCLLSHNIAMSHDAVSSLRLKSARHVSLVPSFRIDLKMRRGCLDAEYS